MKNLFVPYEIALQLKEKGFDEECLACFTSKISDNNFNQFWYSEQIWDNSDLHPNPRLCRNSDFGNINSCTAPLWQQAVDWFREKHEIEIQQVCRIPLKAIEAAQGRLDHLKHKYIFVLYRETANPTISRDIRGNDFYEVLTKAIEEALKLI